VPADIVLVPSHETDDAGAVTWIVYKYDVVLWR